MSNDESRAFYEKIIFKGEVEIVTGIHVGSSRDVVQIGGVDSPVIRDPITNRPYIPGSSLKGKMRSLLELFYLSLDKISINRGGKNVQDIRRHECETRKDALECPICRVFGSTGKGKTDTNHPARIIVRDLHLTDSSVEFLEKSDLPIQYTEYKYENAIDRITAAANPRQIERVPRGARFSFEIIYNNENPDQKEEDLKNIKGCLRMIEEDTLGGHGSRGYGKVKFDFSSEGIETHDLNYYLDVS